MFIDRIRQDTQSLNLRLHAIGDGSDTICMGVVVLKYTHGGAIHPDAVTSFFFLV